VQNDARFFEIISIVMYRSITLPFEKFYSQKLSTVNRSCHT